MDTQIDYLRLASWDFNAYVELMPYLMEAWPDRWQRGKWLQYVGWRKESVFVGRGMQGNKAHTILNISGSLSHEWHEQFLRMDGWYSTRIDLQRTILSPLAKDETLATVRDDCNTKKTTLIESEENDTLYLGSRTSDKFTRLYEKILEGTFLRLEFELKGFRSRATWDALRAGESLDKIYYFYLERSALPERIKFEYGKDGDISTDLAMRLEIEKEEAKSLKWIISLDESMMKNMGSHGIGEQVKIIVRAWAKYADHLDRDDVTH
jgi:hypothetical protein